VNALGLALLNGNLGGARRPRPAVIDEPEVRRILDGLIPARRQPNTDVLAPYLEGLSAIRIGLRNPVAVEAAMPDAAGLASVWAEYHDLLQARGAVDFDDQVSEAIALLLGDPSVRAAAQARCRHLLCDEFQDLAPAHLLLLRLLAAPAYDVFGVGDDDQVIYGYAGATPSFLIDFEKWFPGSGTHALEVNYRCPTRVIDAARHLLSYNDRRIDKTIRAPLDAPAGELRCEVVGTSAMADVAVDTVRRELRAGTEATGIAVLARVNSALLPVQIGLTVAGISSTRPLDRRVLERTGVRTALAWLRLGADPAAIRRSDVVETIRRPSRRISRNVVEMITKRAHTSVQDIRRLAARLSGGDVEKLLAYAADIDAVARAVPVGTAAALAAVRTTVGLGRAMDSLDASRAEADRSTHGDDLRALEQVAALHPHAPTFGSWLAQQLEAPGPEGIAPVTLSTIHRVKGQEWPVVIVFGAHDEAFPHRLATDVEEERRVFHVAITRARRTAVVLADAARPSPFVAELSGERPRTPLRGRIEPDIPPPLDGRRASVSGNRSGLAAARATVTAPEADPAVWEALRTWRLEVAGRDAVPAFVVLSNKHLQGIGARRPKTLEELRQCPGMGPTKLERYGDEILSVLDSCP
jgi:DNA helicase-2/ATP-dependent DNA helicase PcrA